MSKNFYLCVLLFAVVSVVGCHRETQNRIIIGDKDVPKLGKLTESNFGKRMLIICRNKLIAAPSISMPLNSNRFYIPVKDVDFLNSLRK